MGSICAARFAGYIPKKMPIVLEKPTATSTVESRRLMGMPIYRATAIAPPPPMSRPIKPPIKQSMTDSVRNWSMMVLVFAPRAFLIPISLVRSVTDTSIMFITPTPPTSREIALTAAINVVNTLITVLSRSINVAMFVYV